MDFDIKGFYAFCRLAILPGFILISSCQTIHPTYPISTQQSIMTLNESVDNNKRLSKPPTGALPPKVNSALLPPLSHYINSVKNAEPKFDVNANNVPAKEFFAGLVMGTSYNMIVHPNISGNVTLSLKDVTFREAMDAARDMYGYEYHRTSYGYEVMAPQLETQLFHINYLDVQRKGRSYTQLTTGQVSNKVGTVTVRGTSSSTTTFPTTQGVPEGVGTISSIETKTEMQFWKDLEKSLQNIIGGGEGRTVTINSQAGIINVRGYPGELKRVANYIRNLQTSLNRQVILEAKILEVQLDDEYQAGIDWSILSNPATARIEALGNHDAGIGQAGTVGYPGTDIKPLNGIFAIRINGDFAALISLLQTQGNVQVLSSPHISTVNNQKAVIKVGSDEFFVTGVSTSNTIIGTNTLPSQNVDLTPFFSGITLDVTPEISKENTVVLHIHPSVSKVREQTKVIGLGSTSTGANNLTLPLAFSTIRESDNIVRAKNGQVIVIGGLMQNLMRETVISTPGLGSIPFIGAAFRRTKQTASKSELVILLRPIIATSQAFTTEMEDKKGSFEILKRPFHAGSLPKIFGNEAERDDNT